MVDFFVGGTAPSSSHRRPTRFTTPLTVAVLVAAQFHRVPLSGPPHTLRHDELHVPLSGPLFVPLRTTGFVSGLLARLVPFGPASFISRFPALFVPLRPTGLPPGPPSGPLGKPGERA